MLMKAYIVTIKISELILRPKSTMDNVIEISKIGLVRAGSINEIIQK